MQQQVSEIAASAAATAAEKCKNSFPEIRKFENYWVKVKLDRDHGGGRIKGRLLQMGKTPDLLTTFITLLPVNRCEGSIKINVESIEKITLDSDLQHHFDEADEDTKQEIIDCLEGRKKVGEVVQVEEEEEKEMVQRKRRPSIEEMDVEEEIEFFHVDEGKEDNMDLFMQMMMEQEEEMFNEIDNVFREVELQFQEEKTKF